MTARFLDVVPDHRIVYVHDMQVGEARISVSLVTVVLEPARGKTRAGRGATRMTFTVRSAVASQRITARTRDSPGAGDIAWAIGRCGRT